MLYVDKIVPLSTEPVDKKDEPKKDEGKPIKKKKGE